MKIRFTFEAGSTNDGHGINFIQPEYLDEETMTALEDLGDPDEIIDMLHVETPADDGDPEDKGYNEMVDLLAGRLTALGVDLKDVDWWYGSNEDGTPKHV